MKRLPAAAMAFADAGSRRLSCRFLTANGEIDKAMGGFVVRPNGSRRSEFLIVVKPVVFKYVNPKSWKNFDSRLEIGLDTIRVGYFPHPISWHQSKRLKARGWQYIAGKKLWRKQHPQSGIRIWHSGPFNGSPGWVGLEGSLARVLQPNNSSMTYNSDAAFATLKKWVDDQVLLETATFKRVSPAWSSWFVNRVDVTGDLVFDRIENVSEVIEKLRSVKMAYRPRTYSRTGGIKWTSSANRIALSVYDKFGKDPLPVNKGKLRLTVIFQDKKSKAHLGKYNMKSVKGLMSSAKWLKILRDEVLKMRPATKTGVLRLLVNEAWKAQSEGGGNN